MSTIQSVSGLDDLFYSVTLLDGNTNLPLNANAVTSVSVVLCFADTTTALGPTATQLLVNQGNGKWSAVHDDTNVLTALTAGSIAVGQQFDMVLHVGSLAVRRLSVCRRVAILDS